MGPAGGDLDKAFGSATANVSTGGYFLVFSALLLCVCNVRSEGTSRLAWFMAALVDLGKSPP